MSTLSRRTVLASLGALAIARSARADGGGGGGGGNDAVDEAIARVSKARASLKTVVGPFTQERTIGLLATSVRSKGTITLVRPDRLRWELDPPDDVIYWITPEGLAYRSKTGQGHVPPGQARLASSLDDLRTLLGGDLGHLRARYDMKLIPPSNGSGELWFEATPRDPAMPLKLLRFGIAADGITPRFTELVEGARDKTRIEFGALQHDVPVDPAVVRPPP